MTTGRRRRCGWLDLVVVRYSNILNGFTSIALTKLDILDTFEEIKIGVAYKLNGNPLDTFPADLKTLAEVEVEYITLPGWKTDISNCRTFDSLPVNAQNYVRKIEELGQVKGKEREREREKKQNRNKTRGKFIYFNFSNHFIYSIYNYIYLYTYHTHIHSSMDWCWTG